MVICVTSSGTRVLLAGDDILVREGLAGLLERSGFRFYAAEMARSHALARGRKSLDDEGRERRG
jgi:hypothetical protein